MASPTTRALELFRKTGWTCGITERWNPHAKIRQDLFGFCDFIAMNPTTKKIAAVQATSGNNHATRERKIEASEEAVLWLESGGEIYVASSIKRKNRYVHRVSKATLPRPGETPLMGFAPVSL